MFSDTKVIFMGWRFFILAITVCPALTLSSDLRCNHFHSCYRWLNVATAVK